VLRLIVNRFCNGCAPEAIVTVFRSPRGTATPIIALLLQ
jgi:hypothetical protein